MAKCQCGREMLKANGCRFKRIVVHGKNTKSYDRIKVGDPGDWYEEYVGTPEEKNIRCGDCGAKIGFYHHANCDNERCPICGGQLITTPLWDMPYGSLCDECSKRLNEQVHGKYETPWQKVEQGREERSTPWWFDL